MNFNFLTTYSLPTVIIAVIIGILSFVSDKFFSNKIKTTTRNYLTFFLAIILYFIYEIIFVTKCFALNENILYLGILSGSLATAFSCALNKILSAQSVSNALSLIIEGVISGIISDNALSATVLSLENLFASEVDEKILKEQIINILAVNAINALPTEEYERVATLLIYAVRALDKTENKEDLR